MVVDFNKLMEQLHGGMALTEAWYTMPLEVDWLPAFKQTAINFGYSYYVIAFNTLQFGAGTDRNEFAGLMINPFVEIIQKMELPIIQFHYSVYEALKDLPDHGCDDPLTDSELIVCKCLPGGYDTVAYCQQYGDFKPSPKMLWGELDREFYRPHTQIYLFADRIENGITPLHPWLPRPMNQVEINAIFTHNGYEYLDTNFANCVRFNQVAEPVWGTQESIAGKLKPGIRQKYNVDNTYKSKPPAYWINLLGLQSC